jgi:hypothetical protein
VVLVELEDGAKLVIVELVGVPADTEVLLSEKDVEDESRPPLTVDALVL